MKLTFSHPFHRRVSVNCTLYHSKVAEKIVETALIKKGVLKYPYKGCSNIVGSFSGAHKPYGQRYNFQYGEGGRGAIERFFAHVFIRTNKTMLMRCLFFGSVSTNFVGDYSSSCECALPKGYSLSWPMRGSSAWNERVSISGFRFMEWSGRY